MIMATTMDNTRCPKHKPAPPCPLPPVCDVEDRIMAHINRKFASNDTVARLANEIRRINDNIDIKTTEAATAAAGLVLRQVRTDIAGLENKIDNKKEFKVLIVPAGPEGTPMVSNSNIDGSTMYLTPNNNTPEEDNKWDEWLAIWDPAVIGNWRWEHIGAKTIDLTWINNNFEGVNQKIHELQCRMGKFSKEVADAILKRAVKPLQQLREYLGSQEFMGFLVENLPLASSTQNGLMSSQSYALLFAISNWINFSAENQVVGGGAYDANIVNDMWNSL